MVDQPVSTSTSPTRGAAEVIVDANSASVYALVSDVAGYERFSPESRAGKWLAGALLDQ